MHPASGAKAINWISCATTKRVNTIVVSAHMMTLVRIGSKGKGKRND